MHSSTSTVETGFFDTPFARKIVKETRLSKKHGFNCIV